MRLKIYEQGRVVAVFTAVPTTEPQSILRMDLVFIADCEPDAPAAGPYSARV